MPVSLYEVFGYRGKKQEFSVLTSFFMSIGLTIVAIIPAVVLAVILGVE